jgi:hypothetical protein
MAEPTPAVPVCQVSCRGWCSIRLRIGFVTLQGWCVHFCTCKSVGARTAAEMLCLSDGWGVVTWLHVCGTTNNSIMSCVGHQILFHHHHQITKLSHSINAIGPAPHRSGHQILFVTV